MSKHPMGSHSTMFGKESERRLLRLRVTAQNYDWGQRGRESMVAKLCAKNSGMTVEPEKPYAELCMGTHASSPSFVISGGGPSGGALESVTLKAWISKNPDVLGEKVLERWDGELPFLFKVLSVEKALSIQAHPDVDLGKLLHKSSPDIYKDANHKPEIALAITRFEALCGFISLEEFKDVLLNVPEILQLVGESDAQRFLQDEKEPLKSLFTKLMLADNLSIADTISKLKSRLHMKRQTRQLTDKEELVLRLEQDYPADVGVLLAFFLNYMKLNPGEALYLGANEPHTYLHGDCVECMAASDNVVRAGLTPKRRDVQTLCSMLTYKQGFPKILPGMHISPHIKRYLPPFDEVEVDHCSLSTKERAAFPIVSGPSIFIVVSGEGEVHTKASREAIKEGDILFAPSDTEISLMTTVSELQVYRAGVNSRFFGDL